MYQILPGLFHGNGVHGKPAHDRIVSIIAQPTGITDGYQKQIQRRCRVAALIEITVMDQPVIQPTELFGNLSNSLWGNGLFGYHGVLLC